MLQLEAPPRSLAGLPTQDAPGTLWQRWFHGVRHLTAREDWAALAGVDWPLRIMHQAVTDDFHAKQGRSTGRWILEDAGRRSAVYLKRHYRLPWWHGLLATLWPGAAWSPGLRERRNLLWAARHGLPVPHVVAAGEWIGPRLKLRSFLAIEELVGMLPLHEAIPLAAARLPAPAFSRWKATLAEEMARLARLLHDHRRFHKDFYLCHFYVPEDDTARLPAWTGRVHLIDLHRLRRHGLTWPIWLVKDLGGLLYSSEVEGVTARDRLRFWRAYLGGQPTLGQRCLGWLARKKAAQYRRHNQKTPA
jgi:heptose I phosphotransferase